MLVILIPLPQCYFCYAIILDAVGITYSISCCNRLYVCQQVQSLQEWVEETDIGVHGTLERLTDPSDRHGPSASL